MKHLYIRIFVFVVVAALLASTPAWAVNRELVELQTQVQQIQDQITAMKQSLDERMGVIKNLMDQNTDSINKVTSAISNMQATLQKQQSDTANHVDQLSGNMQAAQTQQQQQQQQALNVPPPDVLYNNALRDYNGGNTDLSRQEFSDYIKNFRNTDLAGNAYFYLAEMDYRAGNYPQAIKGYDQVLQSFPDGNKAASAELKKGFAQIEAGQKDAGITTLRHVVQRYPRSNEAMQAKDRLRKLGVATTASRREQTDQ